MLFKITRQVIPRCKVERIDAGWQLQSGSQEKFRIKEKPRKRQGNFVRSRFSNSCAFLLDEMVEVASELGMECEDSQEIIITNPEA